MTFEKWFEDSIKIEEDDEGLNDYSIGNRHLFSDSAHFDYPEDLTWNRSIYEVAYLPAKAAWDFQQIKIEKLEKELKEIEHSWL